MINIEDIKLLKGNCLELVGEIKEKSVDMIFADLTRRYADCTACKNKWNISIKTEMPSKGYECPPCERKRKKAQKGLPSQLSRKKTIQLKNIRILEESQ